MRGDFMGLLRFVRFLTAIVLVTAVAGSLAVVSGAAADGVLAGHYAASGSTAGGAEYQGSVDLAAHGQAFTLGWTLDGGPGYRGLALQLDGVLGAVYWSDTQQVRAPGIVVYRIDGGRMEGIWLPNQESGAYLGR